MTQPFSYSTTFTLDKAYFTECFEQSMNVEHSFKTYAKAIFFALFGAILVLFTEINAYAAWFIFSLGIVEALSVYYQKPWWVTRQMLSRASKSDVKLTIDDLAISTDSFYLKSQLQWQDISALTTTNKGWLIVHAKGKNYISNLFLTEQAMSFLSMKAKSITSENSQL
jgi:hypothetical protein